MKPERVEEYTLVDLQKEEFTGVDKDLFDREFDGVTSYGNAYLFDEVGKRESLVLEEGHVLRQCIGNLYGVFDLREEK